MRTTIRKRWTFDAAHQLPNHDGKCARPHGHTYTIEVAVSGELVPVGVGRPDEGMVVDFGALSKVWKETLEPRLDHQDLNQTLDGLVPVTTAEAIAAFILDVFTDEADGASYFVDEVTVWETPTGSATVKSGDRWFSSGG